MLGFDRHAGRAAWTVFLVALTLVSVYAVRRVLLLFVLAVLFAYLLSPVVSLVDRALPWPRSRTYALAVVYALLTGILVLGCVLIGNRAGEEASTLAAGLPKLVANVETKLSEPGPAWLAPAKGYLLERTRESALSFSGLVVPLLQRAGEHVRSFVSSMITVILIPILAFFFLKDGRELRDRLIELAEVSGRAVWEDILADVHKLLGQFIRALIMLAFATQVAYSVFFTIAGVPYAVLLATVAALLEFLPLVGPISAAAIVVLVSVFSGYGHMILILGFLAGYRIFQDYILSPHLMSSGAAMHPLLIVFGALAGEEIAGVPGMFLSVPVLATLRIVYVQIRKARIAPTVSA